MTAKAASIARGPHLGRASLAAGALALAMQCGCSLGAGTGDVKSDHLVADECWDAEYDLLPDFFAAVPFRETLQIRVQRGNDLAEVSDGLSVLVDDVEKIRGNADEGVPGLLGKSLCVSLPPGVAPPGTPIGTEYTGPSCGAPAGDGGLGVTPLVECEKPLVHMSLYLQRSCHNQNTVLYGVSGWARFTELFSGDPNEEEAAEKLTEATFDIQVGDPRDAPLGEPVEAIPCEKQSRVTGSFRFYFERGQPGQPFP